LQSKSRAKGGIYTGVGGWGGWGVVPTPYWYYSGKNTYAVARMIPVATVMPAHATPCEHAIAACRHEAEDYQYSVECYWKTYSHFLLPISVEDLPSKEGVLLPEFKRPRGRPLTKRIRKGAWKVRRLHCSNCNEVDHNIRKCRPAPALNGQRQQAQGRELDLDASTTSDSSSDSDSDKTFSVISTGGQLDIENAAELSRYDEIQAQAWRIALGIVESNMLRAAIAVVTVSFRCWLAAYLMVWRALNQVRALPLSQATLKWAGQVITL
jgi:hypothetical protein